MPVEAEIAYMAGFVDGEGCIGVYALKAKGVGYFNLTLRIAQATREPLDLFVKHFGGTIRQDKNGYWYWTRYNEKAEIALTAMLPYLRVKRTQAEAVIGFSYVFKDGERMTKTDRSALHREGDKLKRHLTLLKGRAA